MSANDLMLMNEHPTYYDVLDLKPDASPEEIREAYLRTKSAYNKDSVALYTLISPDETKEMLRKIEEAYEVLSNPDRRRDYDRHHGLLSFEQELTTHAWPSSHKKIISIDRVPPMDSAANHDDLLVAPSTDFGASSGQAGGRSFTSTSEAPAAQAAAPRSMPGEGEDPSFLPVGSASAKAAASSARPPMANAANVAASAISPAARAAQNTRESAAIDRDIEQETDWKGLFLRKVREARRISIEEMSGITKVSKTYLLAIEEENFAKLPAAVYLRGFVTQVAKVLRLPHDKVAAAYMAHYHQSRPKS